MRTPSLMAKLLEKSCQKVFQRTSEAILYLDDLLRQLPFKQQTSGKPYWIAYARLHFGTQKFLEWTSSDEELNLCNAVRQLCSVACRECSVLDCVTALESLPHAASYAYDICRRWLASIELCRSWKVAHVANVCPRVRKLRDDTEELVCKNMSHMSKYYLIYSTTLMHGNRSVLKLVDEMLSWIMAVKRSCVARCKAS